jgi:hypothetical protein
MSLNGVLKETLAESYSAVEHLSAILTGEYKKILQNQIEKSNFAKNKRPGKGVNKRY